MASILPCLAVGEIAAKARDIVLVHGLFTDGSCWALAFAALHNLHHPEGHNRDYEHDRRPYGIRGTCKFGAAIRGDYNHVGLSCTPHVQLGGSDRKPNVGSHIANLL
jgi:hypothetical protein